MNDMNRFPSAKNYTSCFPDAQVGKKGNRDAAAILQQQVYPDNCVP
jgi:hypothetical protein